MTTNATTGQSLATAASPTFAGLTISGLTLGSVVFAGTSGLISQDNANLFWDDTNNRLGVGTNSPAGTIEVMATASTEIALLVQAAASQSANIQEWQDSSSNKMLVIAPKGQIQFAAFNETITVARTYISGSSTISNQGVAMSFVAFTGSILYTDQPAFGVPPELFAFRAAFKVTTKNMTLSQPQVFVNGTTFTSDGFIWTGAENGGTFTDQPTFAVANSGTFTGIVYNSFRSTFTIGTGVAIDTRRAMRIDDATKAGTGSLATQHGILINDLTIATTNIPLYVKGTTGKSRHQPQIKFGADAAPSVDVDVNGWILYAGATRVSTQFDKTTNTTLANVTGLSVTTVSGRTYGFMARLFTDSSALGGYKFAIAGTNTATAIIYNINTINNATNAYTVTSRQTALGGSAGAATGTGEYTEISGLITVNAGGTLTVQFAQNASSGTSSVLVGSTFEVWDIA